MVAGFAAAGGEALEGTYANIDSGTQKHMAELASKENLFVSVGSDFHDIAKHWADLGKAPPLLHLSQDRAIWHHPKWSLYAG